MCVDKLMELLIYTCHQVLSGLQTPVYDCLVSILNQASHGLPDLECTRQVLSCPGKLLFADNVFLVSDANCFSLSGHCLWDCPYHSYVYASPRPKKPRGSCLLYLQGRSQAWLLLTFVPHSLPISNPSYFMLLLRSVPEASRPVLN